MSHETEMEYLMARVRLAQRVDGMTVCWEWTLAPTGRGYGLWKRRDANREMLAHRMSYLLHVGPVPEGLTLDHLCRNTICVNPEHLEPVTARVNVRRGKGLHDEGFAVFQRAGGRWVARVELDRVDGRRRRRDFTSLDRATAEEKARRYLETAPRPPKLIYTHKAGERRPGPYLTPKAAAFLAELKGRHGHATS